MRTTSARRTALVAVATASLAAGLSGPALAATVSAKTTTLTIHAARTTVKEHTRDTFTGLLRAGKLPLGGQKVALKQRSFGASRWSQLMTKTTSSKGAVTFTVTPPAPSKAAKSHREQYELVFTGSPGYRASHSGVVTVTVTK